MDFSTTVTQFRDELQNQQLLQTQSEERLVQWLNQLTMIRPRVEDNGMLMFSVGVDIEALKRHKSVRVRMAATNVIRELMGNRDNDGVLIDLNASPPANSGNDSGEGRKGRGRGRGRRGRGPGGGSQQPPGGC